jgi:hypothetical protein
MNQIIITERTEIMEQIIITEKTINDSVSYALCELKEKFVEDVYMKCLNRVDVNLDDSGNAPMPYMYMENTFLKSRYLMTALAKFYLRMDVETEDSDMWLMTRNEYDRFGASHVIGQLNRFRNNNPELKDKVFDLLRDYSDLERRLSNAIRSGLTVMNDPTNRIFQKITMDVSEEALASQKEQLEDLKKQFAELQSDKEAAPIHVVGDTDA